MNYIWYKKIDLFYFSDYNYMIDKKSENKLKNHYHKYKDKLIKIQSLIRNRYVDNHYISNIIPKIDKIYTREKKEYIHVPTIFGDDSEENIKNLEIAFKQRQRQMKEGELAQILIGNWIGWEDLKIGHSSGIDVRKKDNSIIMDVKNKWNTCNSSSQKALFDKLSKYKKENPETRCIWGIINPKPGCKNLSERIIYDGVEIEKIQGVDLFKLVFTIGNIDYSLKIINIVKQYIRKY